MTGDLVNLIAKLAIDGEAFGYGPEINVGAGIQLVPSLIQKYYTLPLAGSTDCYDFIGGYSGFLNGFSDKLADDTPKISGIELPPQRGNLSGRIVVPFLLHKRNRVALEVGN